MSEAPPLLPNATRDLARFAAELRFEHLPPEVVARLKLCLLDGVGVCLHGAQLPWTRQVRALVESEGGAPVAAILGSGRKTSISQAVLVNSTAGHAFEMDDIHKDSVLHPNSLTVPILLAFAEARGPMSGARLLTAMAAGYEVGARVGNAATIDLFLRGFHPQGTSGTFVAAATAGQLCGLDAGRMQHALGVAGSMAAGLMAAQEGAMVKRLHCGRAAQSGVYAALLAAQGFTGITDILEAGYGGFLSSFSGAPIAEKLTAGLGATWEVLNTGFKPYPSVTSIHSALDALREIMAEQHLTAGDIAAIEVGCSHMTYVHTAWPYRPQGVTSAQMNLFYGLAVLAIDGVSTVAQYTAERIADPRVLQFIPRIRAYEDDAINAKGPAFRHACRLRLRTAGGAVFEREVLHRRGSPENPLASSEVEGKFRGVVRHCLPAAAIERVIELVDRFERLDGIDALTEILGAQHGSDT